MNSANKDFSAFLKEYKQLKDSFDVLGDNTQYYESMRTLGKYFIDLVTRTGFVYSLNKDNILHLVLIQSRERFMAQHTFYIYMTKEVEV